MLNIFYAMKEVVSSIWKFLWPHKVKKANAKTSYDTHRHL